MISCWMINLKVSVKYLESLMDFCLGYGQLLRGVLHMGRRVRQVARPDERHRQEEAR